MFRPMNCQQGEMHLMNTVDCGSTISRVSAIIALFLAVPTSGLVGQDNSEFERRFDRFQLYTACATVSSRVSLQLSSSSDITGLSEESIETAVNSRLRSARIYTSTLSGNALLVSIQVVGAAFSVDVALLKSVYDSHSGESFFTATWRADATGTHGRDAQYIRGAVAEYMDRFVDEYLRVNEQACTND